MDIMTRDQCVAQNVAHHSFDQIMKWADDLSQLVENVIVIPKYDCIDEIPERFMLGYSVPTSHGSTPLHVDRFRGRRVHLLGGSWRRQLHFMAALGTDVVSFDHNYCNHISTWGEMYDPDGERIGKPADIGLPWATNGKVISMAVMFGAMGAKLNELYPRPVAPGAAQEGEPHDVNDE
jgi:hypothetical protein